MDLNKKRIKKIKPQYESIESSLNYISGLEKMMGENPLNKNLVKRALTTGFISDKLFEIPEDKSFSLSFSSIGLSLMRDAYILDYGFVAITKKFIKDLSSILQNEKVLEIGAGTGFLSSILNKSGIDITPVDLHVNEGGKFNNNYGFKKLHTSVLETDGIKYLKSNPHFSTILLVWPPLGEELATEVLLNMKSGQKLIYIGEGSSGCTASASFFENLKSTTILNKELTEKANRNFKRFPLMHDKVYVYEKC